MNLNKITWYGRCCFLIKLDKISITIDPHDTFDNIDMGFVKTNYTLISSTWHDHGHIGATPKAIILSEPGVYKISKDITITGILTKENRGSKNVIFNIKSKDCSITNFADLGDLNYLKELSSKEKKILNTTTIAFARANKIPGSNNLSSIDLALKSCNPSVLIPHHYYPQNFIKKLKGSLKSNATKTLKKHFLVFNKTNYTPKHINDFKTTINTNKKDRHILLFNDIHPQVKQIKSTV